MLQMTVTSCHSNCVSDVAAGVGGCFAAVGRARTGAPVGAAAGSCTGVTCYPLLHQPASGSGFCWMIPTGATPSRTPFPHICSSFSHPASLLYLPHKGKCKYTHGRACRPTARMLSLSPSSRSHERLRWCYTQHRTEDRR